MSNGHVEGNLSTNLNEKLIIPQVLDKLVVHEELSRQLGGFAASLKINARTAARPDGASGFFLAVDKKSLAEKVEKYFANLDAVA